MKKAIIAYTSIKERPLIFYGENRKWQILME